MTHSQFLARAKGKIFLATRLATIVSGNHLTAEFIVSGRTPSSDTNRRKINLTVSVSSYYLYSLYSLSP